MYKFITVLVLFSSVCNYFSQGGVGISNTGVNPNPNAMLDVSSDEKGILITRLTTIARTTLGTALGVGENGMLVYDKDLLAFYYWDGTQWVIVGSGAGDNWGTQVVQTSGANISGDGTTGNPLTVVDGDSDPNNEIELPTGGLNGQVLTTDGTGVYSWSTSASGSDDQNIQNLAFNSITNILTVGIEDGTSQTVDLTSLLNDADSDPSNEIELPTGGATGQVLSTNGSGTYSWVNDETGSDVQNIIGSSFNTTSSDLVIGIQNGTSQTVNLNGLKDHDWYEVGGTIQPDAITDNIFTQGNVGIGVSNPAAPLHVFSNLVGDNLNDEQVIFQFQTNPTGNTNFLEAKTRRHIAGNNWFGTNYRIQRRVDATPMGFIDFGIDGLNQNFGLGFGTRNGLGGTQQTRMVIDNTGNVGIGTIAPQSKLDVTSVTGQNEVRFSAINTALRFLNFPSDNSNYIQSGADFSAGSQADLIFSNIQGTQKNMIIKANGNIGIGTISPSMALHVVGGSGVITAERNGVDSWYWGINNTRMNFTNVTTGIAPITLERSGLVGVFNPSPTEALDVIGSVKIVDGTEGLGKVLTSDANGKGSWQAPSTSLLLPVAYSNGSSAPNTTFPATGVHNLASFTAPTAGLYMVCVSVTINILGGDFGDQGNFQQNSQTFVRLVGGGSSANEEHLSEDPTKQISINYLYSLTSGQVVNFDVGQQNATSFGHSGLEMRVVKF